MKCSFPYLILVSMPLKHGGSPRKSAEGSPTVFLYDFDGNIIAESDQTGSISREYLYKSSSRLAMVDVSTGNMYYYGNDQLGTPQIMTDATNTVVWEADYKPFGEADVNPNSTVVNNFRFPGQYYDAETGLHYNYHRYYDQKTGRYLTPDPIGTDREINLFVYASANPINRIDAFGLWVEDVHSGIGNSKYGTYTWAIQAGFSKDAAAIIARSNDAVDGGWGSWVPMLGNQARHFDQANPDYVPDDLDSRLLWAAEEFDNAIADQRIGNCEEALAHLGRGLHSLQDVFAHRNWNTGFLGWNRHPGWYDDWNDPRNAMANKMTSQATISYLRKFVRVAYQGYTN